MTTTSNTTSTSELTFEQLLAKATEVADARKKLAKDFLKFAKEVAIPRILEANQKLGFRYLEVWHDTRLFEDATAVGDGDMAFKFSTRFWSDKECFGEVDSSTKLYFYDGVSYGDFVNMNLDDAKFYGMVKALPLLVKELNKNIEKRQNEQGQAIKVMADLGAETQQES